MERIDFVFRRSRRNHYSVAALLGLLDEVLDPARFQVGVAASRDDLAARAGASRRIVVAYSFCSPEAGRVADEMAMLKRAHPHVVVIAGGPHASARADEVLGWGADAVFVGEAEESLLAWLRHAADEGAVRRGVMAPLPLRALDAYPPFAAARRMFAPIEIRRGCPARCAFCQTPRLFSAFRERSIDCVARHVEMLWRAGGRRVSFLASNALSYGASTPGRVNLPHLEAFLERVSRPGLSVSFGYFPSEVAPRVLARTPQAAHLLRRYVSNRELVIGAQSGSRRTLARMRRAHSVEDAEGAAEVARSAGFVPLVDILLGSPGEDDDDRHATVAFMRRLRRSCGARFNVHVFTPLPGTPMGEGEPSPLDEATQGALQRLAAEGAVRLSLPSTVPS